MPMNAMQFYSIQPDRRTGFSNGGWAYDAYPELETLDAFKSMTVAEITGPAVITCLHFTQHLLHTNAVENENETQRRAEAARGILLEIYFDDCPTPSVRVPIADFFTDGCCGQANNFGNEFVEKAPHSYNCFIPMPFRKSAKVLLVNETRNDYMNYSFVEYEQLPEWDPGNGYFHATWKRFAFQLSEKTDLQMFHVDGSGHLIGRAWSVSTDEPYFKDFHFVMEANNEFRLDGEAKQRLDYLGTEDSFSFSWGFQKEYAGPYAGMNFIKKDPSPGNTMVSLFRFHGNNPIRFRKSLDLRLNWTKEMHFLSKAEFMEAIHAVHEANGGWIDYATTYYWYQSGIGYPHEPMLPVEERCKLLLKNNPRRAEK
jgi:hypothetical protein